MAGGGRLWLRGPRGPCLVSSTSHSPTLSRPSFLPRARPLLSLQAHTLLVASAGCRQDSEPRSLFRASVPASPAPCSFFAGSRHSTRISEGQPCARALSKGLRNSEPELGTPCPLGAHTLVGKTDREHSEQNEEVLVQVRVCGARGAGGEWSETWCAQSRDIDLSNGWLLWTEFCVPKTPLSKP